MRANCRLAFPMITAAFLGLPLCLSEAAYCSSRAFLVNFKPLLNARVLERSTFSCQSRRNAPWRRSISTHCSAHERTIVVGDVHGCRQELEDLLDLTNFDKKTDQLLFVGDLVAKGPDSVGCIRLAVECDARATRGNHEAK
eukprot:547361-Rhodomonas_salina.2